jgi:hypothetical protein
MNAKRSVKPAATTFLVGLLAVMTLTLIAFVTHTHAQTSLIKTVYVSGTITWSTGGGVAGKLTLYQINSAGGRSVVASGSVGATSGWFSAYAPIDFSLQPLTIEAELVNSSGAVVFDQTFAGPTNYSAVITTALISRFRFAVVLDSTTKNFASVSITPTFTWP